MYGKIHSVRYIGGIKFASNIFCKFLTNFDSLLLLGSAIRWSPGLVNFVTALAYHFCLAMPAAFMQPCPVEDKSTNSTNSALSPIVLVQLVMVSAIKILH